MNSLPPVEPQPAIRQLENNLFQQMLKIQQPLAPEKEPVEQPQEK
jgi:hypothetical protein